MAGWLSDQGGWYGPAVATGGGSWASLIPQSGLVSAWPFDAANTSTAHVNDPVGGNNATSTTNFTIQPSGPTSSLTQSGSFAGNSFAQTSWSSGWSGTASGFSIFGWVYPTVSTGGMRPFAMGHPGTTGFEWLCSPGGGSTFSVGSSVGGGFQFMGIPGGVVQNAWNLVGMGFDGTDLVSSINGGNWQTTAGVGPQPWTGPITFSGDPWAFGYNSDYGGDWYTGYVSGTCIYSRLTSNSENSALFTI
jgi:hypothetical protein